MMKNFGQTLKNYRKDNNLTFEEVANKLGKNVSEIKAFEKGEVILSKTERKSILFALGLKKFSGKRLFAKILDLVFRLTTSVMALVTLMLCINGVADTNILIILLSIGLVCSSLTQLPKIEN